MITIPVAIALVVTAFIAGAVCGVSVVKTFVARTLSVDPRDVSSARVRLDTHTLARRAH